MATHDSPVHRLRTALLDLAHRAQARFDAADGAGVTVDLVGTPVFVGSTPFTEAVDAVQYGMDGGPCLTAVETGSVVRSGTIGTGEERWPLFTPQAAALGLRSALSAPILFEHQTIGSLNLYARTPHGFSDADAASVVTVAASLAGELSVLQLLAVADAAAARLTRALADRRDVDIAVGVLMRRYRLSAGEARLLLIQLARQDDTAEASAARELLGSAGAG